MVGRWFGWQHDQEIEWWLGQSGRGLRALQDANARFECRQHRELGRTTNGSRLPAGDTADCQSALPGRGG